MVWSGLAITAALLASTASAASPVPWNTFRIDCIDADTGRGVPLVQLKLPNYLSYYSDSGGVVAFDEPGLLGHVVYFVVLSDGYVMPFSEEVDWSEFSLVVQEKEYLALPNILKDITEAQRAAMRSKGAAAWMKWFHDIGTQLDALLLILRKY